MTVTVLANKAESAAGYYEDEGTKIKKSIGYLHYRLNDVDNTLVKLEDMLLIIDDTFNKIMKRLNKIENRLDEQVISTYFDKRASPVPRGSTTEFTGTNAY